MTRSKRDNLKRNIAQAQNHLASAIVDVWTVRQEFEKVHAEDGEYLETCEALINQIRDGLIAFGIKAWNLDETAISSFF